MREHDENIRLYTPILQRIIVLVAVIIAVLAFGELFGFVGVLLAVPTSATLKVILKVLQNCHWNRKQAARALSISYRALLYKIRDAGLPSNRVVKRREAEIPKQEIAAD